MGREKETEIGKALRAWRARHQLSQSQAALKLNISKRTLQEWEQHRSSPHPVGLQAMRDKLYR